MVFLSGQKGNGRVRHRVSRRAGHRRQGFGSSGRPNGEGNTKGGNTKLRGCALPFRRPERNEWRVADNSLPKIKIWLL